MCLLNQAPVGSMNTDLSISDEIPDVTLSTTSLTYSDKDSPRFLLGDEVPRARSAETDSEIRWTSSRSLVISCSSRLMSEDSFALSVMDTIELN
jgi:hypothetical protein